VGCDIHMFVEYSSKEPSAYQTDQGRKYWSGFADRINPGRDYRMFAMIAECGRCSDIEPVVPNRGMPDGDLGYATADSYWMYVTEEPGEGMTTRARAESWVRTGSSHWRDAEEKFVSHPDWHSHTWLTVDEYQRVIERYSEEFHEPPGVEYMALFAAMRVLRQGDKNDVRVICWFDN
jgi:hypothetical protein